MTDVNGPRVEAAVKAWQDFVNEASVKATGKELRVDARNVREGLARVLKAADALKPDRWIGEHCNGECSDPGSEYCRCSQMAKPSRTDTERLDWLVSRIVTCAGSTHNNGPVSYECFSEPQQRRLSRGPSARTAIDAAIDKEDRL